MTTAKLALLPDRGVVSVSGADASKLLQGVITGDMEAFGDGATAIHAGLLTPQGKILFEFFVVRVADGFLLETQRDSSDALAKRLTLYKLRAQAEIKNVSSAHVVAAVWGEPTRHWPWQGLDAVPDSYKSLVWFNDPRDPSLGQRLILSSATDDVRRLIGAEPAPADAYHAQRIARGVPEGGRDYALGDTFPHEADFDLLGGVSFSKGCFVGQEVVARMEHKSVIRKRVVRVAGAGVATGAVVQVGDVPIGTVGSAAAGQGLALVRIDRVVEALDGGQPVTAGGQPVEIDPAAVTTFRARLAEKADGS